MIREGTRLNNEELLRRTGLGDREAFHQLYENTDRTIYSYILSLTKNSHDAEEVMQETYMKVWITAASYVPQGKPLAWMFTIARNICYMRFRQQKRMADAGLDELTGAETGEVCLSLENMTDALVLRAALELLKEEDRQIVLLHASAGLKHREIAAALQMPLATVLSRYNRAIRKLKEYLKEE
ncbi:MAG: RNA polymerase sigma factor [Eubacteriales bacterium]|nr:RNA polymerase sigma factor [Eubacteriales bacterium]